MKDYNYLKNILDDLHKYNCDFDVYIIADTQNKTSKESDLRVVHADESEFFSRAEFAEIASALFNVFGFAKVFYTETSFINYIITNNIPVDGCIVYNLARDGRRLGKKSLIPAFCDLYNIRYTGCDAFTISLLRHKAFYTDILAQHNIPVPISICFHPDKDDLNYIFSIFKEKDIIVKNIYESASIGLTRDCKMQLTSDNIKKLIDVSRSFKQQVFIQEYIDGIECEVLVLQQNGDYKALSPVAICLDQEHEFIDSSISNDYQYGFCLVRDEFASSIKKSAEAAAKILGIKDYARFDFRIRNGIPYLFDIAGTPYTIRHSSIAYLFRQLQFRYEDIYKVIVSCMLSNYENGF